MKKIWDCRTVIAELREAFKDNIPEGVSIELLMPCGNKRVSPKLREGQELNGFLIHKVFKSKAVYIRPSSMLQNTLDSSDSEDGMMADTQSTSSEQHISTQATPDCVTRARGNQIASTPLVSSYPFTRSGRANRAGAEQQSSSGRITTETQSSAVQQESSGSMARETQRSAVQQASSGIDFNNVTTVNQNDDYTTYLLIMGSISDHSSDDEELNQAIMASLQSHM
ncbi:hypothetical protein JOQ06_023651 [Pogonophryne albipinna]|uniref:Uncharacterized protein n=1 Tax=Pogonophryne albipinna TaxID=1090488 RepID=A0AAD6BN81_9TELE|nr:hypothetical protein JOQ06_023651 [Pogonophryne albipinna]